MNRIQSQQGSIALSVTHGRTECYRTCIIHRISLLATQLLHRQHPIIVSTTGNRITVGGYQYGHSSIHSRISNQHTGSKEKGTFYLDA